jgi:hypothetical protein
MHWLDEQEFERRPLVLVEDHLYHTADLLAELSGAGPDLPGRITAVVLDRPGPDTDAAVADWLGRYPELQVVADVGRSFRSSGRLRTLEGADLAALPRFARLIAQLLRPGGVLVQDVQLSTLAFVPADRWWESIYAAATVRGLFPDRPPTVRFLSNKRGYAATFGRELLDAGFDPRDVMDKAELRRIVVPTLLDLVRLACPLTLITTAGGRGGGGPRSVLVSDRDAERHEIEHVLDLVLWPTARGVELGGRWVANDVGVTLRADAPETATWAALIDDRLVNGPGLRVVDVGARIAPPDAGRAEITNLAARHLHTLRGRLRDGGAIVTANHAYRLREDGRVGRVPPPTFALQPDSTKVAE